jgi:hypothetical protein
MKLKLGLEIIGTLLIANHLGQFETKRNNQSLFIVVFIGRCYELLCFLLALTNYAKSWAKTILLN